MPHLRRILLAACCTLSMVAFSQSGIRLIPWNYEPVQEGPGAHTHYGVGYDRIINERMSIGVDLRFTRIIESWVVNYRSAFHFSDAGSRSVYMGPTVGIRKINAGMPQTLVPIGLRIGIKGGLDRWYGDLYVAAIHNIGGRGSIGPEDGYGAMDLRQGSFMAGVDVGFGWGRSRSKR